MEAFDAHTHLDFPAFDADRGEVLRRARAAGVTGWLVAGAAPADWDRVERIGSAIGAAVVLGVHPWWVRDAATLKADLATLADRPSPTGIGETGLDHLRAKGDDLRALQAHALSAQLSLAREREVPVVLHCVRAYPQLIRLLQKEGLPAAGGMVHAWSGAPDAVAPLLDLGLHLSFGTLVLRSHATRARAALARIPSDRLLLETDCPDQPPVGRERSEPADLVAIAQVAADVRCEPLQDVLRRTGQNARRLFGSRDT